jgi:hypothetical protein
MGKNKAQLRPDAYDKKEDGGSRVEDGLGEKIVIQHSTLNFQAFSKFVMGTAGMVSA